MDDLIEFVCRVHPKPDGVGPLITRADGGWAYCAGHGTAPHDWIRVTPIKRTSIEQAQAETDRAS